MASTIANVKVNRQPAYAVSSDTAVKEDVSVVVTNSTAFGTRDEFMSAVQTAALHAANQLGLK